MRNIRYSIFILIVMLFNIFCVHASCTNEEIGILKRKAEDIKIIYKHNGKVEIDDEVYYNNFEVKIKNVDDDLYFSLYNGTIKLTPIDGEIVTTFNNGIWDFDVYSKKCKQKIHSINVFIPRFNEYSLDPLCEGIDGDDFPLCGKYYEYDVSYDSFMERVNYYRIIHNIKNTEDTESNKDENKINKLYNDIFNFINEFKLYIIIALVFLLIIIVTVIIISKRRKRGVLK